MQQTGCIKDVHDYSKSLHLAEKSIGFVPTMGALHDGHISLIAAAKQQCDYVVVSIFVNPKQFGPAEDFDNYPRTLTEDSKACKSAGADLIFIPKAADIYPETPALTQVSVNSLSALYCGQSRPVFFQGVTNVVARLFNIVQPTHAFFGEKDYQQYCIIKQMTKDLFLPIEIICCPIVRDPSGLALSSRNAYLSSKQKHEAASIYLALSTLKTTFQQHPSSTTDALLKAFHQHLSTSITTDYVNIVNPDTLLPVSQPTLGDRVLFAGYLAKTRLIDTLVL